jgi:hypothetical protein
VEIAQYGEPEAEGSFKDAGFQVVRFDPPFTPPYTITKITFPSLTVNGVPAAFPSVRLYEADPVTGLPVLTAPLFQIAPYSGSANGVNEIPINLAVSDSGKVFYWCIEFPSKFSVDFPNDYPFIRMDAVDMDRGFFWNSFELTPTGGLSDIFPARNLIVSMTCRLPSEEQVPIEGSSNLGANRTGAGVRFTFVRSGNRRADGVVARMRSLLRTDLLHRSTPWGRWQAWASVGAPKSALVVDGLERTGGFWTTQAVDRNGHRAVASSVVFTAPFFVTGEFSWDKDEPNGLREEATELSLPVEDRRETIFPAGDRDNFSFVAASGDIVEATAYRASFASGYNDLDLVMLLYDSSGRLVASDDNSYYEMNPRITFHVPVGVSEGPAQHKFVLQMADVRGSPLSPRSAPRPNFRPAYVMNIRAGAVTAMQYRSHAGANGFSFRNAGSNPGKTARLLYELPPGVTHTSVRVEFYDIQGRLVRSLVPRGEQAGPHLVIWDGKDDQGRSVSSGTYYARIYAGPLKRDQKISILR